VSGLFSKLFGSKSNRKDISEGDIQAKEKGLDGSKSAGESKLIPVRYIGPKLEINVKESPTQKDIEREEMKIAKQISSWYKKEEIVKAKNFEKNKSEEKVEKQLSKKNLSDGERILNSSKNIKVGPKQEYYKTGIKGFDDLMSDGIPASTSVLVEGGPGSGKTIFCLHVAIEFCKQNKRVLYMSFEEPEERLLSHMESFGFEAEKYIKSGNLVIKRFNALDIARSVEALLSEAKKELLIEVQPILIPKDIKPDLVLVDSLTSIASAFSGEESRFRIYMEQLFRYLEEHKMSSLLIREVPNPGHVGLGANSRAGDEATSFLSDGIIVFYNVIFNSGERKRALEILKLRGQSFKRKIVEVKIVGGKGLVIFPNITLKGKNYRLT
jgi:KaiC/GvpD/RAD55 family RecA-like ATPase